MYSARKLNESIKSRFINDLLTNLSANKMLNNMADIGSGLILDDIIDNIYPYDNPMFFSGVYIQCQSDGQILIKAMKAKSESNKKVLSAAFSIKKYGIKSAFYEAVKQRAEFCGYTGHLPLDSLKVPTQHEIYEHIVERKGSAWTEEKNTQFILGLNSEFKSNNVQ